jgi:hypothetical protein
VLIGPYLTQLARSASTPKRGHASSERSQIDPKAGKGEPEMADVVHALAVIIIVLLAVLTVAIFAAVIAASVLVTGAVHREERLMSLTSPAPDRRAALVRRLLAVPEVRVSSRLGPDDDPGESLAWYERTGPRGR